MPGANGPQRPYGEAVATSYRSFAGWVNRGLAEIYRTPVIVEVFRRWFSAQAKPTPMLAAVYFLGAVPE